MVSYTACIFSSEIFQCPSTNSMSLCDHLRNKIVGKVPFRSVASIAGISAFILLTSQLLGNVAVVQLARPNVQELASQEKRFAWAIIAYVSTVGGNLTITGSAGETFGKFVTVVVMNLDQYSSCLHLQLI
jgi:hypothetical protein